MEHDDIRPEEPEDLNTPPPFFPYDDLGMGVEKPEDFGEPVEVNVEGVYVAQNGGEVHRFVLLTDGSRRLPIMIGEPETFAITLPIEGKKPGRPMTHDLMVNIFGKVGVQVRKVTIDDIWGSTYYAKLGLRLRGEDFEIDSRPSDAIALAVRVSAPIFVAEGILEQGSQ